MADPATQKTMVLGAEHDEAVRSAVVKVLRELGARKTGGTWGIGGSQELETLTLELAGRAIVVEAETYIGISLTGDIQIVEEVAGRVRNLAPGSTSI